MTPLPIDPHLPEIIARLRESRALVLVAEPGAGKTTRVPPALLRANLLPAEQPNIVMLQPRRVAARTAAMRIAEENGWRAGNEVGWQVRFERRITAATRLRIVTEGILTRQLVSDPFLDGVGAVVLDEFHERSIHADLAIAMLREIRQTVRPDLFLLVMSATLDAQPVAKFLGACPIVSVPGRTFPIEIEHAAAPSGDTMPVRMARAIARLRDDAGDILAFLPGVAEIERTRGEIGALDAEVLPLHGSLPPQEQMRALQPCPRRKVILATNIAETSLTIEGVRTVIDSGLARVAGYDTERGLDRLDLKRISKASAIQRAGRAGRTAAGRCLRLYTAREYHAMPDFELPEIRRVDLSATTLSLHAWGKPNPRQFGWYDAPGESAIQAAEDLLEMLGAIVDGRITELGRRMVALPVHPRLARLLIASADEGMLETGAAIAALLSERDSGPPDRAGDTIENSDLIPRVKLIGASPQIARLRDDLVRIGKTIAPRNHRAQNPDQAILRLPLIAYPDRVCRRRGADPSSGVMVGGGGVKLAAESRVRRHEFFVAVDARYDDRAINRVALVRIASGIEAAWLEELFPAQIRRQRNAVYDEQRDRVVAHGTTSYRDLVLWEDKDAPVSPDDARRVLIEWLRPRLQDKLGCDERISRWLNRLALLARALPEHDWPGDPLGACLESVAIGKRSVAEVVAAVPAALGALLRYPLDRTFETEAPDAIQVPSNSRIRLEYSAQSPGSGEITPPVLAVRLQEVFGWAETPRVAGGRVPVLMHLLAPNFRPVQVTRDLRSFWANTYFQVRKDLRVRYPKHAWPDDPLTAPPQAKGGRRR